ncbi:MAG: hypothetical protein ACO1QS_03495 [Verrucomicrobiota bacterium]
MLPRGLVILLCFLSAAAGSWAGYRYFEEAARFITTDSVSLLVKFHGDARELARSSFAVAAGLLAFCIPLSTLVAGRFCARGNYLPFLLLVALIGMMTSGAALLYYKNELQSLGLKLGGFFALMRDSKREIALNPLTRSLLFGAGMTLVAGMARGLLAPLSGKK